MAVYAHDSQFMTRRGAVLVTIIALHVFIAWALATGLARRALEVIAPPIQTDIVEERKVEKEPPPPPPPEFEKPPVEVPPPDVTNSGGGGGGGSFSTLRSEEHTSELQS